MAKLLLFIIVSLLSTFAYGVDDDYVTVEFKVMCTSEVDHTRDACTNSETAIQQEVADTVETLLPVVDDSSLQYFSAGEHLYLRSRKLITLHDCLDDCPSNDFWCAYWCYYGRRRLAVAQLIELDSDDEDICAQLKSNVEAAIKKEGDILEATDGDCSTALKMVSCEETLCNVF